MATILRHPVPREFYEPDRPLNDLGRDQLAHFIHVAGRLPAKLREGIPPVPSPEDGMASSRFIAAVTERLLGTKQAPLKIVRRQATKKAAPKAVPMGLAMAAAAASKPKAKRVSKAAAVAKSTAKPESKKRTQPKSKPGRPRT